ncbi:MAG: RluA family pseudouridine synthase [Holophagaceae bacterium]|nr:RluA family pseudouridine synthase [Holophagaceae bacterium]
MDIKIELDEKCDRLDRLLARLRPEVPRSRWESWIRAGRVFINGSAATKTGQRLKAGDLLETELPEVAPPAAHLISEPIDLPTLFEDSRMWIINKPMGMVVHPGPGHPSGTVLNALLARIGSEFQSAYGQAEGDYPVDEDDETSRAWPGLVHRLDRYTSGCMAMAKDENAKTCLQAQFKARTVEKNYLAIARQCRKLPEIGSLMIDQPIARHRLDRTKMTIQSKGKPAQTRIKVLGKNMGLALVSCDILTGRTHQIRVHLASLGAPLLGDPLYGGATAWQDSGGNSIACPYPALHAWKLSLDHPNGERVSVTAGLPDVFESYLAAFGLPVI